MIYFDKINRVEVIDQTGRLLTLMNVNDVRIDLQDDEHTMKVFLLDRRAT